MSNKFLNGIKVFGDVNVKNGKIKLPTSTIADGNNGVYIDNKIDGKNDIETGISLINNGVAEYRDSTSKNVFTKTNGLPKCVISDIAYFDGKYIAATSSWTGEGHGIYYSYDGKNWLQSSLASGHVHAFSTVTCVGNNTELVASYNSEGFKYSRDGINWSETLSYPGKWTVLHDTHPNATAELLVANKDKTLKSLYFFESESGNFEISTRETYDINAQVNCIIGYINDIILIGTDSGLYITSSEHASVSTWRNVLPNENVLSIAYSEETGTYFIGAEDTGVYKTTDLDDFELVCTGEDLYTDGLTPKTIEVFGKYVIVGTADSLQGLISDNYGEAGSWKRFAGFDEDPVHSNYSKIKTINGKCFLLNGTDTDSTRCPESPIVFFDLEKSIATIQDVERAETLALGINKTLEDKIEKVEASVDAIELPGIATSSKLGIAKYDGDGIEIESDGTVKAKLRADHSGLAFENGALYIRTATTSHPDVSNPPAPVATDVNGNLVVPNATTTTKGGVRLAVDINDDGEVAILRAAQVKTVIENHASSESHVSGTGEEITKTSTSLEPNNNGNYYHGFTFIPQNLGGFNARIFDCSINKISVKSRAAGANSTGSYYLHLWEQTGESSWKYLGHSNNPKSWTAQDQSIEWEFSNIVVSNSSAKVLVTFTGNDSQPANIFNNTQGVNLRVRSGVAESLGYSIVVDGGSFSTNLAPIITVEATYIDRLSANNKALVTSDEFISDLNNLSETLRSEVVDHYYPVNGVTGDGYVSSAGLNVDNSITARNLKVQFNNGGINIGDKTNISADIDGGELKILHNGTIDGLIARTVSPDTGDINKLELLSTNGYDSYLYSFPLKSGSVALTSDIIEALSDAEVEKGGSVDVVAGDISLIANGAALVDEENSYYVIPNGLENSKSCRAIAYNGSVYVAALYKNSGVAYSTNGLDWVADYEISSGLGSGRNVIWDGKRFILQLGAGHIFESSDGKNWKKCENISTTLNGNEKAYDAMASDGTITAFGSSYITGLYYASNQSSGFVFPGSNTGYFKTVSSVIDVEGQTINTIEYINGQWLIGTPNGAYITTDITSAVSTWTKICVGENVRSFAYSEESQKYFIGVDNKVYSTTDLTSTLEVVATGADLATDGITPKSIACGDKYVVIATYDGLQPLISDNYGEAGSWKRIQGYPSSPERGFYESAKFINGTFYICSYGDRDGSIPFEAIMMFDINKVVATNYDIERLKKSDVFINAVIKHSDAELNSLEIPRTGTIEFETLHVGTTIPIGGTWDFSTKIDSLNGEFNQLTIGRLTPNGNSANFSETLKSELYSALGISNGTVDDLYGISLINTIFSDPTDVGANEWLKFGNLNTSDSNYAGYRVNSYNVFRNINPVNVIAYTSDLVDYALKTEIPNVSSFVTKDVSNLTNYETKTVAEGKYAQKSTTLIGYGITDAYTKAEVNDLVAVKADTSSVYTKSEIDSKNVEFLKKESSGIQTVSSDLALTGYVLIDNLSIDELEIESLTASSKVTLSGGLDVTGGLVADSIKVGNDDVALAKNIPNVSAFITKDVNNLTNYETKTTAEGKYAQKSDISNVYKYIGSVDTYSALPTTGQKAGDVYNIVNADSANNIAAGDNVAWTGSAWDKLGGSVDLSNYAQKSTTLAGYGITNAYTKTEADSKFITKDVSNLTNYETKTTAEAKYALKEEIPEVPTSAKYEIPAKTPSANKIVWTITLDEEPDVAPIMQVFNKNGDVVYANITYVAGVITVVINSSSACAEGDYYIIVSGQTGNSGYRTKVISNADFAQAALDNKIDLNTIYYIV